MSAYDPPNGTSVGRHLLSAVLLIIWLVAVGWVVLNGIDYYVLPLQERPFSELHDLHRPSGTIGHGLGIVGSSLLTLGVVSYFIRKRVRWLEMAGKLSTWLQVHIFLCTLGPALVLFHTTFKFGGIVSIAFWSMSIVVVSGVFGRYLYGRIPKTLQGQFRSLGSIRTQEAELLARFEEEFGLSQERARALISTGDRPRARGFLHAMILALRHDLTRRSRRQKIAKLLGRALEETDIHQRVKPAHDSILQLVESRLQLEQQIVLLEPFQRVFGYWHLLHLPLAGVMFLVMTVHVAVSIVFGYTWVF